MGNWLRKIIPSKNDRELRRLSARLADIAGHEPRLQALTDDVLRAQTQVLRERFEQGLRAQGGDPARRSFEGSRDEAKLERKRIDAALDPLLPAAFALVREASRRVLGLRHYDMQMVGGMVLHEGKIAEMKTGEGKTLVATLPSYLNALAGRGVHVVTVNEYLAARDAAWMGQLYKFLGMEVGVIVHGKTDAERQAAYAAPITYGTNSEFGFDFLRDNMKLYLADYVQRGLHFAIVDEVDSILIDEARTPLIISGPAEESTDKYTRIGSVVPGLRREQDYTVDEKARTVLMTEQGVQNLEQKLKIDNLYEPENIEILHHVNQALRAHTLYRRDVDYIVDAGKVKIIDEFTGRVLDGRRWSDGLHQAVEAKEGVAIENENQTLATITYQNYFRTFLKLGGMTGTAETEAEEFAKIYDLDVVVVPTNRPMLRQDADDVVYKNEREKFEAIVEEIQERSTRGQPVLVGTVSVEKSEILSRFLQRLRLTHNVLNAKQHLQEAAIIAQAGRLGAVTIATNMAGRGTDILLGGNSEFLAREELGAAAAEPATYAAALTRYAAQCSAEKAQVIEAGGLHILGTERHESRRIDNQLRGRSGRQGDPGSSRFFISLEDGLMRIFGGDRLVSMMERLGMKDGEVIEHPLVNRSIADAQRRVEGHNFDIRKHLIEYDDVMNDQRSAIYKLRRRVLGADVDVACEMVLDQIERCIINLVLRACPERAAADTWDISGLVSMVRELFDVEVALDESLAMERQELENCIYAAVELAIKDRETRFTRVAFYHVARIIYLQSIDLLWKDHLRDMDQLREGISLRGYAQKDPKHEYKKEGYNLFANMMSTIDADVMQRMMRVVINSETEEQYQGRMQAQHDRQALQMQEGPPQLSSGPIVGGSGSGSGSVGGGIGMGAGGGSGGAGGVSGRGLAPGLPGGTSDLSAAAPAATASEPQRRQGEKVGVNDPCPCGSGKKYKKCHMSKENMRA